MSRQAHITLGKKFVSEYLLANVPENAFVQFFKKKKKFLENKKIERHVWMSDHVQYRALIFKKI